MKVQQTLAPSGSIQRPSKITKAKRVRQKRTDDDYSEKVRQVANVLLLMLDKTLINLEHQHKTGSPYWKRLRVRKRLVQTILTVAGESDWQKIREELTDEFFQMSDRALLLDGMKGE